MMPNQDLRKKIMIWLSVSCLFQITLYFISMSLFQTNLGVLAIDLFQGSQLLAFASSSMRNTSGAYSAVTVPV